MLERIGKAIAALRGDDFASPRPGASDEPRITQDLAWADSLLYVRGDFPRYNPDDLLNRKGQDIYKRMSLDEQLKAVTRFRRNAVTGRDWGFELDEELADELGEEESARRVAVFEQAIAQMPGSFRASLNRVMLSIKQGFSMTEKVYGPLTVEDTVYWGIHALRAKPFDSFEFYIDDYGRLEKMTQRLGTQEQTLDIKHFIHHVHNPDIDEWYGQSELREAYRDWFSKDMITKFENIYLERMAGGLVWAQPVEGKTLDSRSKEHSSLRNILSSIMTKTGIIMPQGTELHVEHPTDTEAFERAIARHDRGMARALLMPNLVGLTEQQTVGGYSQSQTQLEGFMWMLDQEAAELEETLNEQLFYELGELNFGDQKYPRFHFKPLSQVMRNEIAKVWGDLISKGAVQRTSTDEGYLREILGFPDAAEDELDDENVPEDTGPGSDDDTPTDGDDTTGGDDTNPSNDDTSSADGIDETIIGKDAVALEYAFSRALRRVDFAAVDRNATTLEWEGADRLGDIAARLTADLVEHVPDLLKDPSKVESLEVPKSYKSDLKRAARKLLQNSWDLGIHHAKREVEKAGARRMGKKEFSRFTSLGEEASAYFEAKAFGMSGVVSEEVLKAVQHEILQGVKYGKTIPTIQVAIWAILIKKGLLNEEGVDEHAERSVIEALATEVGVTYTAHRINTIVRTNVFDAINEGRFQYLTSDVQQGFVTALEYSAILDSRTTEICSRLDGKVYPATSEKWDQYRPPNHFNCRSLLVAVTQRDEIPVSTEDPDVEPSEGFG